MPLAPRKALQYSQVIDCFPLSVRNAIYAKSEYRDYKKGDYVFRDGDEGPYFIGAVMSRRLRVEINTREGKGLLVAMIEKGELFGEMSVFDGLPRAHDIVAEEPSTVMIIKGDDFIPHMLACPESILGLFRISCRRKRHYVRMNELLALQNVKQKLGRHLLHLAQDYGATENGVVVINARLNQAEIGSQLGISRESVNKHMSAFAEQGLLTYGNETITLLDVKGLKDAIYPPKTWINFCLVNGFARRSATGQSRFGADRLARGKFKEYVIENKRLQTERAQAIEATRKEQRKSSACKKKNRKRWNLAQKGRSNLSICKRRESMISLRKKKGASNFSN